MAFIYAKFIKIASSTKKQIMKKIIVSCLLLVSIKLFANNNQNIVGSELKTVTVYKTGAELQHTAHATLQVGNNELIIDNIANQIDINSIQIKTANAVTLMGVEFNNNYLIPVEKTSRIKMLEDSVEKMQKNWDKLNELLVNNNELYEVLRTNRDLKGTQTGMNVAELAKLMDYYKAKLIDLQEIKTVVTEKIKKLDEIKLALQNQLNEEVRKNTATAGRLVLQLQVASAGKYEFTISYIANNAYWTPYYDVRVDDIKSPLKLITKAKISQTTGIDWKQVKLSLSTSVPSQWGNAPVFSAWYLAYINPVYGINKKMATNNYIQPMGKAEYAYAEKPNSDYDKKISIRGYGSIGANNQPIYIVDGAEMSKEEATKISSESIKTMNVLKGEQATAQYGSRGNNGVIVISLKEGMQDYVSIAENTLNQAYDIDLPYDVPTNGKAQTATIATTEINVGYKHYAAPKLDKDVYLLAEIADWGKLNLMPAEANIIFEGTYVGKSFIDPNSTNDTLNLTLGRDKRVVVKRDKVCEFSSVKFLGTNKLQKYTYQLTVKNTKKEAINLLLKDQFPLTTNKDIEVELIDDGNAEVNSELGILNWKLNLAAGEIKKIKFSYTIKYPKDKTVNVN
jgi:TonB-dependent SusC/RagA subfamily outer membrane receptor